MVHMIVRNLDSNKNDDPHSKIIFPYFVGRTTYKLFDHLNSNAYTSKNFEY